MRIVIISSLLFVYLMLVQFYAVTPLANATTNPKFIPIYGDATIQNGIPSDIPRISGIIMHIIAFQTATFDGDLTGEVVTNWHIVQNVKLDKMTTIGVGTFNGTLTFNEDTISGNFTFITVGHGSGTTFHNEWRIIEGTEGFSNIHGKGTLDGYLTESGWDGSYSGSVFFNP